VKAAATNAGAYLKRAAAKRSERRGFWISLGIVIAALLSSITTFLVLNGLTWLVPSNDVVLSVLAVNAFFVLVLFGIIGYQVAKLLRARKRQTAGAGLHFRLAGIFSLVALFPAVLLAVFATVSIDRTFDTFFSTRVKSIVGNSVEVAKSYMQESVQVIRADMLGVTREIEERAALFRENRQAFDEFFSAIISLRALPSAYIITSQGVPIASASDPASQPGAEKPVFRQPPADDLIKARDGRVVPLGWDLSNGVAALKKLNGFDDAYLYAIRPVNPTVYRLLQRTQMNILQFAQLEQARGQYQFVFAVMYVLLALTLLLSAIWSGLVFANRLVAPIRKLIGAAQEVSQGNLDVKQLIGPVGRDDIGRLGQTFTKMTADLKAQRDDIMTANAALDERRRFIETVLSGVSAGVIGLDAEGRITLLNRSAKDLLQVDDTAVGSPLKDLVPEFREVIERARRYGRKAQQSQVTLVRETGERNFAVQVTREDETEAAYGLIVTFDDITELTVAQRTSAWADVARRIAHEIKNPLTPIQLSAERIRRKYSSSITHDREIFDRCTDTIIKHVGDIGRMVDEFSSFARMPSAVFEEHDVRDIVKEASILFQMSKPEIEYAVHIPDHAIEVLCDRRLLTQAVTNLVKNASEAIESFQQTLSPQDVEKGRVEIRLGSADQRFTIDVIDNGCGLPKENRHRLVEPYITTRQKGTGLGLAIVQRITEQHGGVLELKDAADLPGHERGAWIRMSMPVAHGAEAVLEAADDKRKGRTANGAAQHVTLTAQQGASYGV
jgi:two-component system nitrogen regulation sensor histidine kinase NtrY